LAVSGSTVYAGGYFHSIGGQPRNYIAALNAADGTATSWNPGASDIVQTLAVSGSIIYAGGDFTSIGGQPRNFIAALNAADGSPTAFNPNANSLVQAIAVSGPNGVKIRRF
jgi:trimeric autotransporter adhesin